MEKRHREMVWMNMSQELPPIRLCSGLGLGPDRGPSSGDHLAVADGKRYSRSVRRRRTGGVYQSGIDA